MYNIYDQYQFDRNREVERKEGRKGRNLHFCINKRLEGDKTRE